MVKWPPQEWIVLSPHDDKKRERWLGMGRERAEGWDTLTKPSHQWCM